MHRLVKLPDDKFEKMKLIVALAATAQAFVGPTARLPSASVGRTLQVKAQPNMLLGGLRARANNLVPTRRPRRCHQTPAGRLARETPQNPASPDPSRAGRDESRKCGSLDDGEEGLPGRNGCPAPRVLLLLVRRGAA